MYFIIYLKFYISKYKNIHFASDYVASKPYFISSIIFQTELSINCAVEMNLLSADDTVLTSALRRKSLCNGTIMGVTASAVSGTPKKKDRARRGSLSEPPCRRASLVQRSVAQY